MSRCDWMLFIAERKAVLLFELKAGTIRKIPAQFISTIDYLNSDIQACNVLCVLVCYLKPRPTTRVQSITRKLEGRGARFKWVEATETCQHSDKSKLAKRSISELLGTHWSHSGAAQS